MKKLKLFSALVLSCVLTTSLLAGCGSSKQSADNGTVYFYNCGDYIDEDLLAEFTNLISILPDCKLLLFLNS